MKNQGEMEDSQSWEFKFKVYLNTEDENYKALLKQIEDYKGQIADKDVNTYSDTISKTNATTEDSDYDYMRGLNTQLYNALALNCEGLLGEQVENMEE